MVTTELFPIQKYRGWYACDFGLGNLDSLTIGGVTYQVTIFQTAPSGYTGNAIPGAVFVVVGWRTLAPTKSAWTFYQYDGTGGKPSISPHALDNHQYAEIMIDKTGYVHFAGWAHDYPQQYRRSDSPLGTWTGGLTANLPIGTTNNISDTYPTFFRAPNTNEIYILRRCNGVSGNDDWDMHQYDTGTQTWLPVAGTTDGIVYHGYNVLIGGLYWGLYQFTPTFTSDWDGLGTGFLHFIFTQDQTSAAMQDIFHVRWDGTSTGWSQWDGAAQTIPMDYSNIRKVIANSHIHAQGFSTVDANNYPHCSVKMMDASGILQANEVWFDGGTWNVHQLSSNPLAVMNPETTGPAPYYNVSWYDGASSILGMCDPATNIMYVFEGMRYGVTGTGLKLYTSAANDFTLWTESVFYDVDLDWTTFGYDKQQWDTNKILYMLINMSNPMAAAHPGTEYPRLISGSPIVGVPLFNAAWASGNNQLISGGMLQ